MLDSISFAHWSNLCVATLWKCCFGSSPSTLLDFSAGFAVENKSSILFTHRFLYIISCFFLFFSDKSSSSYNIYFFIYRLSSYELYPFDYTSSSLSGNKDKRLNTFNGYFSPLTYVIMLFCDWWVFCFWLFPIIEKKRSVWSLSFILFEVDFCVVDI